MHVIFFIFFKTIHVNINNKIIRIKSTIYEFLSQKKSIKKQIYELY